MSTYLKGKHALVLGASGGIGHAVAMKYLSAGVTAITLTYGSKQSEAETLAEELRANGAKVFVAGHGDRMDPKAFGQLLEDAVVANGQEIDIVADNIGWSPDTAFADQTPELWTKVLAVNLVGCWVSTRAIADRMVAKGVSGRVVIVTSINGRRTFSANSAPYDSSKAGQEALVKNASYHYAEHGVHINGVAPGWVKTRMNDTVTEEDWAVELPKIKSGRQAKPEEVANLIVSLSGEASDYVYGTIVDIEGAYY